MSDELTARIAALSPERRALLEQQLLRRRAAAGADDAIPRRGPDDPAPLSFSQQRLWFLDQWAPGDPSYNAGLAFRLAGPVDAGWLAAAFDTVIRRHEALRTVFRADDGEPRQVVLASWPAPLDVVDVPPTAADELPALLRSAARRPFDLANDLMVRATLFRLAPAVTVLLVVEHHIAFDGWSDRILFDELDVAYAALAANRPPRLPELPIQYADFALWQRRRLTGERLDALVGYWRRVLADAPPRLDLPTDRPRPPVQTFAGAHHPVPVADGTAARVAALARGEGATAYMVLLAAFAATLRQWAGCDDMSVGTPIAGRSRVELEPLIGFFSNTLVLRVRLADDPTFRTLVRRVRDVALGAFEHQELPFEKLVEVLAPPRDPGRNPLFQVNFRVQTAAAAPATLLGLAAVPMDVDVGFSRFDLALELQLRGERVTGYLEYNDALFAPATAAGLARRYDALLGAALAGPDVPVSELAATAGGDPEVRGFRHRRARSAAEPEGRGSAGTG